MCYGQGFDVVPIQEAFVWALRAEPAMMQLKGQYTGASTINKASASYTLRNSVPARALASIARHPLVRVAALEVIHAQFPFLVLETPLDMPAGKSHPQEHFQG